MVGNPLREKVNLYLDTRRKAPTILLISILVSCREEEEHGLMRKKNKT